MVCVIELQPYVLVRFRNQAILETASNKQRSCKGGPKGNKMYRPCRLCKPPIQRPQEQMYAMHNCAPEEISASSDRIYVQQIA